MRCLEGNRLLSDGRIRYLFERYTIYDDMVPTINQPHQPHQPIKRHDHPGQQNYNFCIADLSYPYVVLLTYRIFLFNAYAYFDIYIYRYHPSPYVITCNVY